MATNGHAEPGVVHTPAVPPGCVPIAEATPEVAPVIQCIPVKSKDEASAQTIANRQLGMMNFLQLPEVGKQKSTPIALVAGGPSLLNFIEKIRTYRVVMSVSTVHDFLIERGIFPRYHVMFDPCVHANGKAEQGSNMGYFNRLCDTCTYLICSHCDPLIFEHFRNVPTAIWHPAGDVSDEAIGEEGAITGGCTAMLRSIIMAIIMGYWDIHMFGLDSSYDGPRTHAYDQNEPLNPRVTVKIDGERAFDSNIAWVAQAQQFFDICKNNAPRFRPTVFGDGMIAHMLKLACRPGPAQLPVTQQG